jgi:dCTP deaminase
VFGDSMILDQINRGRIKIEGGPDLWVEHGVTQEVTPSDVLQPCSYELTLGSGLEIPAEGWGYDQFSTYWLQPGEFILGHTAECVTLSPEVAAFVHGKSTLGRRGLTVHITAGLIDPGFSGQITLEIYNHSKHSIALIPGMRICQLTFEAVIGKVQRPYGTESLGSHYQNQRGATPAA